MKLLEEVDRKERELAHCKLGKVSSVDREELDRLERSLASSIREQGRNLGSVIEESVEMSTEAGRISERVGELHSEWIRQPGERWQWEEALCGERSRVVAGCQRSRSKTMYRIQFL